jgi:hypothetical protein
MRASPFIYEDRRLLQKVLKKFMVQSNEKEI